MQWSTEQTKIFEWFETGEANLLVRARAGTGKTTTIIEGIKHASDESILLCAFNKRIATELNERLEHPNAQAMTLHSVGFRAVRRFWTSVRLESRSKGRAYDLARRVAGQDAPDAILALVAKLHTLGRETNPLCDDWRQLRTLAWEHDCVPDPEWEDYGYDVDKVCLLAFEAMDAAASRTGEIDFSDMIFLPVRNNWLRPEHDLVVVDEAQDMNAAQLAIAQRICRRRACVVGDDRQAIYGFRGADSGALDRLKTELRAVELGLTTTYRCGKSIVKEAQAVVPDYRAAEHNPDGTIRDIEEHELLSLAKSRDVVLSRWNAPLVALCLRALKDGIAARVEGRDIAAGLRKLVKDLAKGKAKTSIPAFLKRLDVWEKAQVARAEASGNGGTEKKVGAIRDKADALRNLADGASGIADLQGRIEDVFTQIKSGDAITFSSVHKAKGLEWKNVFALAWTFREDKGSSKEESNIKYVAITRAIESLTWVAEDAPVKEKK